MLDYQVSIQTIADSTNSKKRKSYNRWSEKDRFQIGKYAAVHGASAAAKKFATKDKPLNESSARRFSALYKEEIKKAKKDKRDPKQELAHMPRGRPLLLGSLDQMVQRFLLALRSRGGVVSRTIAIAVARALITRNPQYNLGHVKVDSYWAQSLFRRMGFKRRMRTTGKVEIPEGARREAELLYLHDIVSTIERHDIPSHLVMNLDQTPLKYIPAMNHTMANWYFHCNSCWSIPSDAANLWRKNA